MGTFFLTPGLNRVAERAGEWRQVAARGHEIANHTMTHSLQYETAEEFERAEIAPSERWLDDYVANDYRRTFTYPYGRLTLASGADYTQLLPKRFIAARGGSGGPVSAKAVRLNPFNIAASAATWAHDSADTSIAHMEAAAGIEGGWSVLLFHDVFEQGQPWEGDTNRGVHREIIRHAGSSARFWVAPFREVFRYIVERR